MAVGLDPPDKDFWGPIGVNTDQLSPRDKIYFLSRVIREIGRESSESTRLVERLPVVVEEIYKVIAAKFSDLSRGDAQLLVAEFIISEYLNSSMPDQDSVARILSYFRNDSHRDDILRLSADLKGRWTPI